MSERLQISERWQRRIALAGSNCPGIAGNPIIVMEKYTGLAPRQVMPTVPRREARRWQQRIVAKDSVDFCLRGGGNEWMAHSCVCFAPAGEDARWYHGSLCVLLSLARLANIPPGNRVLRLPIATLAPNRFPLVRILARVDRRGYVCGLRGDVRGAPQRAHAGTFRICDPLSAIFHRDRSTERRERSAPKAR